MNKLINYILMMVATFVFALPVMGADPVDQQEQPIFIESDSLDIDDRKGISTYRGNVLFRQGGTRIWADVVVVYSQNRQDIEKIMAEGKPARFEQEATEDSEETKGEATHVEYHAAESLVILDGEAKLQRGQNHFVGNRIEYESDNKVVRAGKSVAGEGRVKIMIQPGNGTKQ